MTTSTTNRFTMTDIIEIAEVAYIEDQLRHNDRTRVALEIVRAALKSDPRLESFPFQLREAIDEAHCRLEWLADFE